MSCAALYLMRLGAWVPAEQSGPSPISALQRALQEVMSVQGPWAAPGSHTRSGCLLSKVVLLPFCRQDLLYGFVPRAFVLCCPFQVRAGEQPSRP